MLNSPRRKPVPGRRWRKLAPAIVSALLLASGCAQVESGGPASGKTELKCAISSPRDSGDYQAVETFAKTLAQKSNDRLTVKVYPDSQLGDYASVIQQIKAGTIDCLYESIGTLATGSEVAGIEAVPYLYRDVDEFSAVWSGEIGKRLLDQVADDTGIRFVGPAFRGFRQLATQAPLDNIDGLQGRSFACLRFRPTSTPLRRWARARRHCPSARPTVRCNSTSLPVWRTRSSVSTARNFSRSPSTSRSPTTWPKPWVSCSTVADSIKWTSHCRRRSTTRRLQRQLLPFLHTKDRERDPCRTDPRRGDDHPS